MTTTMILIALSGLIAGAIIGFGLTKIAHPDEKKRKNLEQELEQSQQDLKDYQHEVTSHFLKTSAHINDLTQQYRDLHEHLSAGAMKLASPEISRQMIDAGYGRLSAESSTIDLAETPAPPKDYAPKVPGGILSEDYGLAEETAAAPTPGTVVNLSIDDQDDEDPTLKVG